MAILLPRLRGNFEQRLWQIGAVVSAAKKHGCQFALFNGISKTAHDRLSAGIRNLAPFAEASWPSIALPIAKHDGNISSTVTDLDELKISEGAILCDGRFRHEKHLDKDYYRGILKAEAPFTVPPPSDELKQTLKKSKFVHFDGSRAQTSAVRQAAQLLAEDDPDMKLLVVGPMPSAEMERILEGVDVPLIFASDHDRPVALTLMSLAAGGPLLAKQLDTDDLVFWAHFLMD